MSLTIIDTHQHLWDLEQLNLPWVKNIETLNKSFLTKDYLKYTHCNSKSDFDYSIDQSIYMEVDVAEDDIEQEIDLILQTCHDPEAPTAAIIASCRPGSADFAKSLETAERLPEIRGFRRVLHVDETPTGFCLDPSFVNDVQKLAENNLPFDICIRRNELKDVAELANRCPENQFVLDHCGNADARISQEEFESWAADIQRIARCENVVCKVSGFVWTIQNDDWSSKKEIDPILRVVFEAFGENRILFGGDWPVCTLSKLSFQQWLNTIYHFANSFGSGTVDKLFSENAKQIYGL